MRTRVGRSRVGAGLALVTAFAATIGLAVVAPTAHAATTRQGATVSPEVEQQLGTSGRVNVVATLNTTAGSEPAPDPATEQAWKRSVGNEAQALVDRMPEGSRSSIGQVRQSRQRAVERRCRGSGRAAERPGRQLGVTEPVPRSPAWRRARKTMGAPVAWATGYTGTGQVGRDHRHRGAEEPPLPRRASRRRGVLLRAAAAAARMPM